MSRKFSEQHHFGLKLVSRDFYWRRVSRKFSEQHYFGSKLISQTYIKLYSHNYVVVVVHI